MRRKIAALTGLLAGIAGAQIPVTDIAHISTSQLNWAAEAGEWATSEGNQLEQISNQVQQISQMKTQLERLGDPAALAGQLGLDGLLDISRLTELGKSYESLKTDADPAAYLSRIGAMSGSGGTVKNPEAYRQYATHAAIADDYKDRSENAVLAKAAIQKEMDQTSKDLDAATTDSEVQRAAAKMAVLQGQMTALNNQDVAAAAQSTIEANNIEIDRRAKTQAEAEKMDQQRTDAMKNASQGSVPEPKPVENPFLK